MRVYLVTFGNYEDSRNSGIFSSKEKAEAYIFTINETDRPHYYISEFELDSTEGEIGE